MIWLIVAGALAMVLAAAGAAWALLRRGRQRIDTPEDAAASIDAALPGFVTAGVVVGSDGAAALAVDGGGRVAVCRRLRAGIAVREVAWTAIRATAEGMLVDTGDRRLGAVIVAGVDALDVRRLAPHLTRG